jgi:dipeptidyl aminopeptidase/acylaminoacyl peptidase
MNFTKSILGVVGLVAMQIGVVGAAHAADDPLLRIEAGMHIAPIVAMATDTANRFVATGSEDKTVRLWSLPGGRPVAILRIPVGRGSVGKIYSVAVSPDGALVAVGGWTTSEKAEQVYLLDSRTGALVRRLTGLSNVTSSLAFSPDGQFLVAGLGGQQGIVVYDARQTWRQVATDTAYGGVVKSLAFDSGGRLATSCSDGVVRIYAAGQFERPRATKKMDGRPDQIAYSPDGGQLAVAFADQPRIAVLSAINLSPLFKPDVSGLEGLPGGFHAVTWSASGDVLMAGGSVRMGETGWLRRWSGGGRGFFTDLPAANDTVRRLVPLRDGGILFATMGPAFGVITPAAAVHVLQASGKLDFRSRAGGVLAANELGDVIDADVVFPIHRLVVSMRDRSVGLDEPAAMGILPPRLTAPGLSVTGWRDGLTPALNG